MGDHDPPKILSFTPSDGADRTGVQSVGVNVTYRDSSHVTARVFVGSEYIGTADRSCTHHDECTGHLDWDTAPVPPGQYDLTVALEDAAGNISTRTNHVLIDDALTITSMEVHDIVDESGTLEIEVYAFDEAGSMIGCAGSRHGLSIVDYADVIYPTRAMPITTDGHAFGSLVPAGGKFSLEVWEDDDEPVCPDPLNKDYNDFVGASPLMTADEWRTKPTIAFSNVPQLSTTWSRPVEEGDVIDPPVPRPDPWIDEDGSCSARGGVSSGLVVALAALFGPRGARRRRRRSRLAA